MLGIIVEPNEHMPGRAVVGEADDGARTPMAYSEYAMAWAADSPPDPVRSGEFDNYETSTGVYGQGIEGARRYVVAYYNPFWKHFKQNYGENEDNLPAGKPGVIWDQKPRVLDSRMQFPGQQKFRYDRNIPRPAYMSFSDLLDQEGVY
jgi:hypothetical protein